MTYTELLTKRWDGKTSHPDFLASLSPLTLRAWMVLSVFTARVGFLDWWNGIEDAHRNDIFLQLMRSLPVEPDETESAIKENPR